MVSPTFDLAQYPTIETIKLLASLLERMTNANDQLNKTSLLNRKPSSGDMRRSTSASPISNNNPLSSPIPTTNNTTTNNTNITNTTTTNSTANNNYTLFHARSIPSIDIYSYLSRILKYCPCANECFLSLLVYFDRMSKHTLAKTGHPFTIDSFNIHRLIISGVMVSSKFFSDIFYTNTRYAKVGGLPVSELNRLELEFLQLNEFNISVSISELQKYGDQLLKLGMIEQQERRMMYDHPSSYTIRHGRSTSLGSTALIKTLDGLDMNNNKTRKSLDQSSIQQLTDTTSKLYLDDNSHVESSSIKQQQRRSVNEISNNNKDMYIYTTYTSPSSPHPIQVNGLTTSTSSTLSSSTSSSNINGHAHLRRMGSMNNIHTYQQQLQHSPISFISSDDPIIHNNNNNNMMTSLVTSTSTSSTANLMNTMTTPPLFIRQQSSSRYFDNNNNNNNNNSGNGNNNNNRYHQRNSFTDWPTNNSPPKTRQRHESLGTNNKPISIDGSSGWRIPRQTRSSVNLYQQNLRWANNNGINHHHNNSTPLSSSLTSTSSSSSSIIDSSSNLQQQQLFHHQLHQSSSHHQQQQQRRLSLNSIHAPPFIPQRPSSGEYIACNNNNNGNGNGSYVFYPVTNYSLQSQPPHHHLGIPTPPPSSSPIHYKPENCHPYPSSSTQQLYL